MPKKRGELTDTEEKGHREPEIHPHIHEVKYKNKKGDIIDYKYNYGKIASKHPALRKIQKR